MSGNEPSHRENDGIAERTAVYLRALDLHDETGQILTAIMVNLQRLGGSLAGTGAGETVRDTQRLVETLFYSIRNFIRDASGGTPHPAVPRIELGPALRRLTRDFARRTGIGIDLRLDADDERMTGQHKAVLYRVVQESLTNVFRHSGARTVTIRFSRTDTAVTLEIQDDGALQPRPLIVRTGGTGNPALPRAEEGGETGAAPGGRRIRAARAAGRHAGPADAGSGLRGMKERVRIIGGECTVRMVERRGMTVRVVLPYNIS